MGENGTTKGDVPGAGAVPRSHSSVLLRTVAARRRVAPLMALALVSLLVGMWAGLGRIGWQLPATSDTLPLRHGGLMVVGFVGTVIGVERAVAVRSLPAFAAPAFSAACGVALLVGAPTPWAPALAFAAGGAHALNMVLLTYRHRTLPFAVMLAGAVLLVGAGGVWWGGGGIAKVVPWWIAFLVLTVAAERLELLRFQRLTRVAMMAGTLAAALIVLAPPVALIDAAMGARALGLGLVIAALWLLQRDNARRTVQTDGLARYMAAGLLSGYAWLGTAGVLLLVWALPGAGLRYDAIVHTFFIGFVFSSIMAHEPVIAPSVSGLPFRYTPLLYLPLALLNGMLAVRVWSDVASSVMVRRWAGLTQVIAILLFLAVAAYSVRTARSDPAHARA